MIAHHDDVLRYMVVSSRLGRRQATESVSVAKLLARLVTDGVAVCSWDDCPMLNSGRSHNEGSCSSHQREISIMAGDRTRS